MTWTEAVKALKEGKKVRQNVWSEGCYIFIDKYNTIKLSGEYAEEAHQHLDKAKNTIVDALNSGKQHYEHEIKGEQTHPEGYVVKYKGGNSLDNVAKVVNRQEFSRKNFLDEAFQFLY